MLQYSAQHIQRLARLRLIFTALAFNRPSCYDVNRMVCDKCHMDSEGRRRTDRMEITWRQTLWIQARTVAQDWI